LHILLYIGMNLVETSKHQFRVQVYFSCPGTMEACNLLFKDPVTKDTVHNPQEVLCDQITQTTHGLVYTVLLNEASGTQHAASACCFSATRRVREAIVAPLAELRPAWQ
jgi:hypothetical protein